MKKILLLLLAFPLLGWIAAAEVPEREVFPRGNAIWNIKLPQSLISAWYGLIGDTIMDGTTYQKLYQLNDSTLNQKSIYRFIAGIRQQDKKVYMRTRFSDYEKFFDKDILLYDFSLKEGDWIPIDYQIIHPSSIDRASDFSIVKSYSDNLKVVRITTDEIGRKHYKIEFEPDNFYEWIEGIGGTLFWTYFMPAIPVNEFNCQNGYPKNYDFYEKYRAHLNCMKHNDTVIYINTEKTDCKSCFCMEQLEDPSGWNIQIETFSLKNIALINYNNNQNIHIELKDNSDSFVFELYDLNGILLQSQPLANPVTEIPLRDFMKGVYLYRISDSANNTQAGKIILQ